MKVKSLLHGGFLTLLSVALILGLSNLNKANALEDAKHAIVSTVCCVNGNATGNANDCVSGGGHCVDHACIPGETESANVCP
jgi:hypothetical protein